MSVSSMIKRGGSYQGKPRFLDERKKAEYYGSRNSAESNIFSFTLDHSPQPGDCLLDRADNRHYLVVGTTVQKGIREAYTEATLHRVQLFVDVSRFLAGGAVNDFGRSLDPEPVLIHESVPAVIAHSYHASTAATTGKDIDPSILRYNLSVPKAYEIKQHDRLTSESDAFIVRAVGLSDNGLYTIQVEQDRR